MARLSIRKVAYRGEKWSFESPWLGDGLQILVGRNGAGKSTFSNLIYYCLGGRVTSFEQNDKAHHREIVSDSKNYVELLVEIDSVQFRLKRYFNSNEIGIQQANGDVEVFSVTRSKDNTRVFSDWMLERLGIDPVTLYYGAYVGKINLTDLFRLIYHDQSPIRLESLSVLTAIRSLPIPRSSRRPYSSCCLEKVFKTTIRLLLP